MEIRKRENGGGEKAEGEREDIYMGHKWQEGRKRVKEERIREKKERKRKKTWVPCGKILEKVLFRT